MDRGVTLNLVSHIEIVVYVSVIVICNVEIGKELSKVIDIHKEGTIIFVYIGNLLGIGWNPIGSIGIVPRTIVSILTPRISNQD
jgi:hypothetical protein